MAIEGNSWEDDIRTYEASKRGTDMESFKEWFPKRILNKGRRVEQAAYDIIRQQHRNVADESILKQKECEEMIHNANHGMDTTISREQVVDIINHRSRYTGSDAACGPDPIRGGKRAFATKRSGAEYDILEQVDFNDDRAAMSYFEERKLQSKAERGGNQSSARSRDFDIISNKYLNEHERKSKLDHEFEQRHAMSKLWETASINLLTGVHPHSEVQEEYEKKRQQAMYEHGVAQQARLPAAIRESEGALYDIVSMSARYPERLEQRDREKRNPIKPLANRKLKYAFQTLARIRDAEKADVLEQRMLGRVAHRRFEDVAKRGYDILNHASFNGVDRVRPQPPRTRPSRNPLQCIWKETKQSTMQTPAGISDQPLRIRSSGFQYVQDAM